MAAPHRRAQQHPGREKKRRSQPTSTVLPSAMLRPRDAIDDASTKFPGRGRGGSAPELSNKKWFSAPSEAKCLLSLTASAGSCCCSRGPAQLIWERRDGCFGHMHPEPSPLLIPLPEHAFRQPCQRPPPPSALARSFIGTALKSYFEVPVAPEIAGGRDGGNRGTIFYNSAKIPGDTFAIPV